MPKRKRHTIEATSRDPVDDANDSLGITFKGKAVPCVRYGTGPGLIFTHGAGGGMHAPATSDFVKGFSEAANIISFQGTMNLKSRVNMFGAVLEQEGHKALGGRSMGSRAAVMARSDATEALILVSYPLIGDKGDRRDALLLDIEQDVLFVIGDRDKMCPLDELAKIRSKMRATWLVEVAGANHGMISKGGGKELREASGRIAAEWLCNRNKNKTYLKLEWADDGQMHSGWTTA